MDKVWRIRADQGTGWIRHVDPVGVIVTGLQAEAAQWADRQTAVAALRAVHAAATINHHLIHGPASARIEWGEPHGPGGAARQAD